MGGSTATSIETVPEWMRPYLEDTLKEGADLYGSDSLSYVEGLTDEQKEGMSLLKGSAVGQADTADKSAMSRDVLLNAAQGGDIVSYNSNNMEAMKNAAVRKSQQAFGDTASNMASSGLVGGRRAELVKAQRDAELTANLAGIDYQDYSDRRSQALSSAGNVIQTGSNIQSQYDKPGTTLTNVGKGIQEQNQREQDAPYQGYQRWLGALQGVPTTANQATTGGK